MENRWETLASERKNREGSKNFIEVKLTKDTQTNKEFLTLAKGFVGFDGSARYNKAISINFDEVEFVVDALKKMKK